MTDSIEMGSRINKKNSFHNFIKYSNYPKQRSSKKKKKKNRKGKKCSRGEPSRKVHTHKARINHFHLCVHFAYIWLGVSVYKPPSELPFYSKLHVTEQYHSPLAIEKIRSLKPPVFLFLKTM